MDSKVYTYSGANVDINGEEEVEESVLFSEVSFFLGQKHMQEYNGSASQPIVVGDRDPVETSVQRCPHRRVPLYVKKNSALNTIRRVDC